MVCVLITGFGHFPGAPLNPTAALARRLAVRRRPVLADHRRVAHVFRTAYAAVEDELPRLIERHRPDVLLMFGLASRTPWVRIERCAQNRMTLLFPDADGMTPPRPAIRPGGSALAGRAPFARLVAAVRAAGVPARPSRDAGRYLCNLVYFRAIEQTAGLPLPPLVIFVHVPLPRSRRPTGTRRRPASADLARAGEAILTALVAAAARRR